jgi:hypothetical protein
MKLYIEIHNWRQWFDVNGKLCQEVISDVYTYLPKLDPNYLWQHLCIATVEIDFPVDKIPAMRIPITIPLTDGVFAENEMRDLMEQYWDSEVGSVYPDMVILESFLTATQYAEAQRVVQVAIEQYITMCDTVEVPNDN